MKKPNTSRSRRLLAALLALSLLTALAACAPAASTTVAPTTDTPTTTAPTTAAPTTTAAKTTAAATTTAATSATIAKAYPSAKDLPDFEAKVRDVQVTADAVTFTDGSGQSKTIRKHPQRVASLYVSHTTLWYEAGGTVTAQIRSDDSADQLPPEALNESIALVGKSSSGKSISVETVLAQKPDLILLATAMSQPTLEASFVSAGVQVIVVENENLADYLKYLKIFSELCGKPEKYQQLAEKALSEVRAVLLRVPAAPQPKVLILFSGLDEPTAILSGTTVGGQVRDMHGINLVDKSNNAKGTRIAINLESMLQDQPDLILIQCIAGVDTAKSVIENSYGKNPAWLSLNAVKQNKVYYLPKELFHYKPNSRYGEAYTQLVSLLYP